MSDSIVGFGYVRTTQGICKIIEIVCSLMGVLLVGFNVFDPTTINFKVATSGSIIVTSFLFVIHITTIIEKFRLPWNKIQFYFHAVWAIYYLIAILLIFIIIKAGFLSVTAAVFGSIATLAHVVDAVVIYKREWIPLS